ncbi:antitoxin [Candidatus Pacearchaeota archaeon]|nr:antitoxin [Candidatus Pacearchaeota archaeon]
MTKVISLSDDAYNMLKDLKEEGESFSDVVRRIVKKKQNLLDFAGCWKGDKEELDMIEKKIYEDRKKTKPREIRL